MQRWHKSLFASSERSLAFLLLCLPCALLPLIPPCLHPSVQLLQPVFLLARWQSDPSLPSVKTKTNWQTKWASQIRLGTGSVATFSLPFCSWGFAFRWAWCPRSGCELSTALLPEASGTFGNSAACRGPARTAALQTRAQAKLQGGSWRDTTGRTGIRGQAQGVVLPGNAGKRHGTTWALSDGDGFKATEVLWGELHPCR